MEPIRSIRQKYKDFSKVNKRIADYILKDPTRLLSLTANEIASNSETSPASVTRFSKQLGFELDKKKMQLEEPIRALGMYIVPVKLHKDVTAKLSVKVEEAK